VVRLVPERRRASSSPSKCQERGYINVTQHGFPCSVVLTCDGRTDFTLAPSGNL
jgi:hypothetical protein